MLEVILNLLLLNPGQFIASFSGKYIDAMQLGLVVFTTLNHSTFPTYVEILEQASVTFSPSSTSTVSESKPEMKIQPETINRHNL